MTEKINVKNGSFLELRQEEIMKIEGGVPRVTSSPVPTVPVTLIRITARATVAIIKAILN